MGIWKYSNDSYFNHIRFHFATGGKVSLEPLGTYVLCMHFGSAMGAVFMESGGRFT